MASRPSGRRRARSNASTTPWPAAPCSATAPTRGRACTCTSAATRFPSCTSTTTTTGADAVSRIDEANLAKVADELGVGYVHRTAPDDVGEIADDAAGQAGTVYAGERDTVRRLYWLPAFGVIGLVLWQFARTTLEIVDDRRALGGRTRRASA